MDKFKKLFYNSIKNSDFKKSRWKFQRLFSRQEHRIIEPDLGGVGDYLSYYINIIKHYSCFLQYSLY